ncbi:MAG: hypothetical protein KJ601_06080 [Nanoarchaeota archaeon]|nr:hypothetical protein [Nanoarchaeota archaeon]
MDKSYFLLVIVICGIFFINGCVQQSAPGLNISVEEESAPEQGLQIVVKDVGFPEIKFLQPTITEIQLQDESRKWTTIYSNPEGEKLKLTPDGAEIILDTVSLKAGTYVGTRLKVSTVDVDVDINKDGDSEDEHVEIILTEEEFLSLPKKDQPARPSAPQKPAAPEQPSAPDEPDKPAAPDITGADTVDTDKPSKPSEPDQPDQPPEPEQPLEPEGSGAPYKIVDGLVYMGEYLDEKHTVTLKDYLVPHFDDKFVYGGSGGKIIYDFTLHPLYPQDQQISVDVFITP